MKRSAYEGNYGDLIKIPPKVPWPAVVVVGTDGWLDKEGGSLGMLLGLPDKEGTSLCTSPGARVQLPPPGPACSRTRIPHSAAWISMEREHPWIPVGTSQLVTCAKRAGSH